MSDPTFVTVMLTGLAGPPTPADHRGDAARRDHVAMLRECCDRYGGEEVRCDRDGPVVVFASAVDAVRCAIAVQQNAVASPGGRPMRIGLDAGEPVVDDDGLSGRPVLVAAALRDAARDGEVLASEVVRRLAGPRVAAALTDCGSLRLPGIPEPIRTATVRWRDDPAAAAERQDAGRRDITVVVADDQRLLRTGFRVILDSEPDITVVGEAGDGRTVIDVVKRRRPDVVLMDIRMPELDGLTAAERILDEPGLTTAVVMLTTFDASEYVFRALRIGASGFLLKDTPADRLLDAVRVAAAGDALIAPSITRRLIGEFTRAARPAEDGVPDVLAELTPRELDVLRLVARGLSNAEIADQLVLGQNTVKTHVARMLGKLGLRDRVQAVVLAYETGLVTRGT